MANSITRQAISNFVTYSSVVSIRASIIRKFSSIMPMTLEDVVIREIRHQLRSSAGSTFTVLDIGAGSGHYWEEILSKFEECEFEISLVDAVHIEKKNSQNKNITFKRLTCHVPSELKQFEDSTFDLVVAFDLIEHLSKENGYFLLYEVDRIAKKSSIIFTPNGFVWQPPSTNNHFNAHISGWSPRELRELGFTLIRGHTGAKKTRLPYGITRPLLTLWPFSEFDAMASLFVYRFHRFAFAYSAVKRAKNLRIENQDF